MQIRTLHDERRRSDKAYGHRMVALTATLEEGDGPVVMPGVLRDSAQQQRDAQQKADAEARRRKAGQDEERYRREHEEYRTRVQQERDATLPFGLDVAGALPPDDDEDDEDDEEDA